MKETMRNRPGFTIIEVLIVLSIAGLIMAIVFIAFPQLQRSSRDNQRQNILSRMKSEMESYASNNQGTYPFNNCGSGTSGCWGDFYTRYINSGSSSFVNDKDPTTGVSVFGTSPASAYPAQYSTGVPLPSSGVAKIIYGAKCQGETVTSSGSSSGSAPVTTRNYAMIIGLDRTNTYFCVDNG